MREEILKNQCEYYIRQNRESKEWWEELRKLRHNMKQHYILENTYLEKDEYVEKLYVPINAITGEEFYDMEG